MDSAKWIQSKTNVIHTALVQKISSKMYSQGTFCLPGLKGLKSFPIHHNCHAIFVAIGSFFDDIELYVKYYPYGKY